MKDFHIANIKLNEKEIQRTRILKDNKFLAIYYL